MLINMFLVDHTHRKIFKTLYMMENGGRADSWTSEVSHKPFTDIYGILQVITIRKIYSGASGLRRSHYFPFEDK